MKNAEIEGDTEGRDRLFEELRKMIHAYPDDPILVEIETRLGPNPPDKGSD